MDLMSEDFKNRCRDISLSIKSGIFDEHFTRKKKRKKETRFSAFLKPTKYLFERRMLRMNGAAENETHSMAIYYFALSLAVSE